MENYADYEFYVDEYQGKLSNDLFDALIVKASRDIDRNVNCELTEQRINQLNDRDKYRLQYAACQLCDYINSYGNASSKAKDISIDGVKIVKDTKTEAMQEKEKAKIYDNLPQELTRYL